MEEFGFWGWLFDGLADIFMVTSRRGIDTSEIVQRLSTHGIIVERIGVLWFYIPALKDWPRFMGPQASGPARVYRVEGLDQDGRRRRLDVLINPGLTFEPQILKSRVIG